MKQTISILSQFILKTILYFLIIFIFTISIIVISEFISYSHLSKKDNVSDKSKFLISNFHPLFKIGKNTLKNLYVYESPHSLENILSDPILGDNVSFNSFGYYTDDGSIEKINRFFRDKDLKKEQYFFDDLQKFANNKKIILCLGSSTTGLNLYNNWPTHLYKYLHNISPDEYLVINLAHGGFDIFLSNQILFYWIMPELLKRNLKIEYVLSMDGVTDIENSLSSLILSNKNKSYWHYRYTSKHQVDQFFEDENNNFFKNMKKLFFQDVNNSKISEFFKIYMPLTFNVFQSTNDNPYNAKSYFELLFPYNNHNVARLYNLYFAAPLSSGAWFPDDLMNVKGVKYSDNFEELVSLIKKNEPNNKNLSLIEQTLTEFSKMPQYEFDDFLINLSLENYKNNLQIRKHYFSSLGIKNINFLQPFFHGYNEKNDIPNAEYALVHWKMRGDILGEYTKIPLFDYLKKLRKIYNSDDFVDLSNLLKFDKNGEYFTKDSIHYNSKGSKYISDKVIEYLY